MTQTQGHSVGCPTIIGQSVVFRIHVQMWGVHRDASVPAVQTARADMQVRLSRQRPDRGATELLKALLAACLLLDAPHARPSTASVVHGLQLVGMIGDQFTIETALEILGNDRLLGLVTLVEKREAERLAQIVEDLAVLGPGDQCTR